MMTLKRGAQAAAAATCVIFIALLIGAGCAARIVPGSAALPPNEVELGTRAVLENGDWLLARGRGRGDNFIAAVTNSALSHAALYDAERDEIIEAQGAGVRRTSLVKFIADSQRVLVLRPIWANEKSAAQAVAWARGKVGRPYNFTGLVGLNAPDSYYCTQLVMLAYKPKRKSVKDPHPIPPIIKPDKMYHWGRVLYDSGPSPSIDDDAPETTGVR